MACKRAKALAIRCAAQTRAIPIADVGSRVGSRFSELPRPANKNWPVFGLSVNGTRRSPFVFWSVSSNRTGLPDLLYRIVARSIA